MKKFADIQARINELITFAEGTMLKCLSGEVDYPEQLQTLKAQALSFTQSIYGKEHSMYTGMVEVFRPLYNGVLDNRNAEFCLGYLKGIKAEIDGGWLGTLKGNIMAESFSDFMEMGDYFLNEGYKDPAAVMFGGVLEEHLRQLSKSNKLEVEKPDGKPKMGAALNDQLKAAQIYNDLVHKAITKNLAIRNASAHGEYSKYTVGDVRIMHGDVLNILLANPI